ncbi:MAG: sugar nucleotide-binding protein, partial [Metallosphaera sp.]
AFLVYISTDYVFDGTRGDYREEDETNPVNIYGLTKLEGEKLVSDVDSLVVRTSTPYGSNPASGKDNFALWLLKRLKAGERVNALVDQVTSPTLNTNFSLMLREAVDKRIKGVLHLAGRSQVSRYDFSLALARTFGLDEALINPAHFNEMKWFAKRPMNSSLNVSKAMSLEHKPMSLQEALSEFRREIEANDRVWK